MNKFKNKRIILSLLILGISIGFAALATTLSILGTANVSKQTWNVHWENVSVVKGATLGETPVIDQAGTTVTYEIDLDKPGDTFSFTVDAKNDGSLDAMITNLSNLVYNSSDETTPIDLPDYINYTITYSDGVALADNQLLKAGKKETYLVTVKYDEDHLANTDITLKFKLTLDYQMDDGTGQEVNHPVCKRAEKLHTEECERNSDGCYAAGYYAEGSKGTTTITYGNLGIVGQAPAAGDAFDCDVNGDGNYDEEDERFYYVSPRDADEQSEYSTLIYYNSVDISKYDSSNKNYNGPTTLLNELPSTSEWSNSKLNSSMTRQIKNELGTNTSNNGSKTLPNYTYTDRAARLLTTQEVENACGITIGSYQTGELDTCQYLLENTAYSTDINNNGWWLETPRNYNVDYVYIIYSNRRYITSANTISTFGVRPAIEVKLTDIAY